MLKKEKLGFTSFIYGEDYSALMKDSDLYSINIKKLNNIRNYQK